MLHYISAATAVASTSVIYSSVASASASQSQASKPNLVYILTDDQDQMLGGSFPTTAPNGATPLPKTRQVLQEAGATAMNFYIHTPICNPSRSELWSGRYLHNIKYVGHDPRGGMAMHVNMPYIYDHTFAKSLKHKAGYTVGAFGKFLNAMPKVVPDGFDAWMCNEGGTYHAPEFMTKGVSDLDPAMQDGHWQGLEENYTTAVVGNISNKWIHKVVTEENNSKPFFAYIGPKAAHEPFNPAPWYADAWDPTWPDQEPITPNWNASFDARKHHHGVIATNPLITDDAAALITAIFKNRWRTLMSVDDLIADTVALTEKLDVADNTYFFYTSDHGFQLGQFNILMDKRHIYEWNTRIHLLARGPGIKAGSSWSQPATQVDMAPTLLGLAGLSCDEWNDGKSIVPLIVDPSAAADTAPLPQSVLDHIRAVTSSSSASPSSDGSNSPATTTEDYAESWRRVLMFQYYFNRPNLKCPVSNKFAQHLPPSYPDFYCLNATSNVCWDGTQHGPDPCYPTESKANNFIGLKYFEGTTPSLLTDFTYGRFADGDLSQGSIDFFPDSDESKIFTEIYNNTADTWQLNNLAFGGGQDSTNIPVAAMEKDLQAWYNCAAETCP